MTSYVHVPSRGAGVAVFLKRNVAQADGRVIQLRQPAKPKSGGPEAQTQRGMMRRRRIG